MSELTIRPIEEQDLVAIAEMTAKLADHVRPGLRPKANADNLKTHGPLGSGLFQAIIATRDGRAVGFCLYSYLFSGWRGAPGLFVNDLFVESSERGSGLGTQLLSKMIALESPKGCSFIKLEVDRNNQSAQGFYQRLGFEKDTHDDVMIMEISAFMA